MGRGGGDVILRLLAPRYQSRPLSLFPFPFPCSCPHLAPSSSSLVSPMRKLFNRDKPKLAKVTPASREVPPDLTSANSSEVIPFFALLILQLFYSQRRPFCPNSQTFRLHNPIIPTSNRYHPPTSSASFLRPSSPITQLLHLTMSIGTSFLLTLSIIQNRPSSYP